MFRLFISHSGFVRRVGEFRSSLRSFSIHAFVAHKDIAPTSRWQEEIEDALKTCDAIAPFLTISFHKSDWTDQEVGYCLSSDVLVIPLISKVDPYGFIARYQGVKTKGRAPERVAEDIFKAVMKKPKTAVRMAEVLVGRMRDSASPRQARRSMELLDEVPPTVSLPPSLLRDLGATIKGNRHIRESFDVEARIHNFVDVHKRST